LRKTIDNSPGLFSRIPQSRQVSAVYDDIEELTELLVIYFKQGIEKGEYCLWISPDELAAERATNELKKSEVDVEQCIISSQLEIITAESLPKNITILQSTIKKLAEKAISGDVVGFRTNFDFNNSGISLETYLEACEKAVEMTVFDNIKNFTLLCTFPLNELSGSKLLELIEENSIFVKRKGLWKYLGNLEGQTELEEILLKAKKDAEATNRAKNGLMMNISHEIRTPLNSVIGFSDLLLEGAFGSLNTRQSKYVNNILLSGKNLLEIINNLLDISRLEAGERELNYEEVDIGSLIREVRMSLLSPASNKKIVVELKVDASIGNILADRTKLRQILYNLISNAIKFTPEKGKVTVSAFKKKEMLEIIVSDTGTGLLKEYYEKMFMPSTQADLSTTVGYSGPGIGLYIVKNFIDLHRGKIWVDSKVGKGSTFTFALPID
jgi:signal transduction histidine kinase